MIKLLTALPMDLAIPSCKVSFSGSFVFQNKLKEVFNVVPNLQQLLDNYSIFYIFYVGSQKIMLCFVGLVDGNHVVTWGCPTSFQSTNLMLCSIVYVMSHLSLYQLIKMYYFYLIISLKYTTFISFIQTFSPHVFIPIAINSVSTNIYA